MIKSHTDKNLKVREVFFFNFNTDFDKNGFLGEEKLK